MAFALGLTQCKKKNIDTITQNGLVGKQVYISLHIENSGKHIVYPDTGIVEFSEGDKLYVGNDGKYIDTLTYQGGVFSGTINDPQKTDYLHLYFIGGLEPGDITKGVTTDFTLDIADQSSSLPVLSYNHSTRKYTEGITNYGCMLLNKCGLVKFTLAEGTSEAVKVAGMKTGVTINFADPSNPIVANGTKDAITLKSESATEKWAILLPQEAVSKGLAMIDGKAYNCDIAAVENNSYITTNTIDNTTPSTDKVFTVSKNGNVVRFSPGNLQYDKRTGEYSFMEHQYDVVETEDLNVGTNYSRQDIVGLFGWGTGDNPTMTSEDTLDYEVFKDWGDYCGDPTGNSYHWFTLSEDEWVWLIGIRAESGNEYTLHYYYVGTEKTIATNATSFTMDFVNQDGSLANLGKFHIGHGTQTLTYEGGTITSVAGLRSLVSIGYFDIAGMAEVGEKVYMYGDNLNNKISIDFSTNEVTNTKVEGDNLICLGTVAEGTTCGKYVMLVPNHTDGTQELPMDITFISKRTTGTCNSTFNYGIVADRFYCKGGNTSTPIDVAETAYQTGTLRGEFTINNSGDKVHFSQGNLKCTRKTAPWGTNPSN